MMTRWLKWLVLGGSRHFFGSIVAILEVLGVFVFLIPPLHAFVPLRHDILDFGIARFFFANQKGSGAVSPAGQEEWSTRLTIA
jgi:hypothetical protein